MSAETLAALEKAADETSTETLPRLSAKVMFGPEEYIAGATMRLAKHTVTGKYFRMGIKEVFLLSHLDGTYTSDEILARYQDKFGTPVSRASWRNALDLFARRGLTEGGCEFETAPAVTPHEQPANAVQPGPFSRKLLFWNPDKRIMALLPYCRWLINGPSLAIWGLLVLSFELWALTHREALLKGFLDQSPRSWLSRALVITLISSVTMTVHEFGHAVACKRYGGEVREMGFLFRYFSFCAYTRIDDILLLPKRTQRIHVLIIGPLISLSLIPFALLLWLKTPASSPVHTVCCDVLIWYNLSCLIQLIPFIQFDGYFILAQILRMPELRKDSYNYLLNRLFSWGRKRRGMFVASESAAYLIPIYVTYGITSVMVSTLAVSYALETYGRSFFHMLGVWPSVILISLLLGAAIWRIYSVTLPWIRNVYKGCRSVKPVTQSHYEED